MTTFAAKRRTQGADLRSFRPSDVDPHPNVHGVLLSDEIIFYSEQHNLIRPFNRENLKPAGYELTVGNEYFLSGSFFELDAGDDDKRTVTIPPFDVAILKTTEIVCMPTYLIARWNIRVRHAYSGLLWVGGPQVDPGYVGHLFCPIYNLSDKPVTLQVGDPIALMDFVKTTPFDKSKPDSELKRYVWPPKRMFLEDYGISDLRSALFTRAGQKLVEFEDQIKSLEARFINFTQISFAIFALVIALIALTSRANAESIALSAAFWGATTITLSFAAILIALFSYARGRVGRLVFEQYGMVFAGRAKTAANFLRRAWWLAVVICFLFAGTAGVGLYYLIEPFLRDFRQQHVLTKSDLDGLQSSMFKDIRELSDHLRQVEGQRVVTSEDLERLRREFDQKILSLRPSDK
jgi:deoxycytidine triphosphate deaminase